MKRILFFASPAVSPRRIARLLSAAALACAALSVVTGNGYRNLSDVPPAGEQVADLRPLEVRIRKLHVVRPDLLRFPMQYDIYC